MKRRAPRGLDPEERDLWDRVARTATPLEKSVKSAKVADTLTRSPKKIVESSPAPFKVGSEAKTAIAQHNIAKPIEDVVRQQPVEMDKKAFRRLKRGQSKPEARLDLHGMTLDAAHAALLSFVLSAHAERKRLVLIITGKGRNRDDDGPIPRRVGVLRHQVPHWLSTPPLAPVVLQVTQAHQRHGGLGALYVYLRRR